MTVNSRFHFLAFSISRQILQRRQIIEDRKEMLETENNRKEKEEQDVAEEQKRKALEIEQDRLNKEAEERDRHRADRERAEIQKQLNRERLEKLKTTVIGSKIVKVKMKSVVEKRQITRWILFPVRPLV